MSRKLLRVLGHFREFHCSVGEEDEGLIMVLERLSAFKKNLDNQAFLKENFLK